MFDLTTPQRNIWNLQKFYEGTSISNICGAIFLKKKYDHQLLNRAINKCVELQNGMRLRFCEQEGRPVQYVADYKPQLFPSESFLNRNAVAKFAEDYAKRPFALIDQPMFRFILFDVGNESGIIICTSHLIADAWSISIIANKVLSYYQILDSGAAVLEDETSYLHFVDADKKYLQSERYKKDEAYWTEQYLQRPESAPIKPGYLAVSTPRANRYTTQMSADLSAKVDEFSEKTGISQAILFESVMLAYLSRINQDNRSISIGVPVLNRASTKEKQTAGMFISTTPLTVQVAKVDTVFELFQKVEEAQFGLFRHQRFPYSDILRQVRNNHNYAGSLFDVSVSVQNAKTKEIADTQWFSNGYCETGLEFHIDNRDSANQYTVNIDYQTELFPQDFEIVLLTERIFYMIEQIIRDPKMCVADISILPNTERERILHIYNNSRVPTVTEKCIHELFQEQARKRPDDIAIICDNQKITYKQLEEQSNALAWHLQKKGIGRGSIVPILAHRTYMVVVAMLGILKSGAAYMPVDPSYPIERLSYMFADVNASLVLTLGYAGELPVETLDLDSLKNATAPNSPPICNTDADLCYVIFTSGSTGAPKGTLIGHKNIRNTLMWRMGVEHTGVVLNITNMITDTFTEDYLSALLSGRTFDIVTKNQDLNYMAARICSYGGNVDIMATPTILNSLFSLLPDSTSIQTVTVVGEKMNHAAYEMIYRKAKRIINEYGPSECSVCATCQVITREDSTIGKPVANTQIYVVDKCGNPMPIGIPGELCIAGEGVGLGYLNRPELTHRSFVPNHFATDKNGHGKVLYHTGDMAAWRTDGTIDYLGRIDSQVKIRGLRIELEEIESVMADFPGMYAVAVADKRDAQSRQYLVGYYVANEDADISALRKHMGTTLPQYMIPNYFMRLSNIPTTGSGKTDRQNLPVPELAIMNVEHIAPETSEEKVLCTILKELFQTDRIGVTDNFFEVGGDSLRAIEYVAKAHNEGICFALQNVFDYPSVRELCRFLNEAHITKVKYDSTDFEKYHILLKNNVIDDTFEPNRISLGNVLLTGATGFLGSHILDQLMKLETGRIYCLVRGGQARMSEILSYYFANAYTVELGNRIVCIDGDIANEQLINLLPNDVQTVIHAAATVKHYGTYDEFFKINVEGTKHIAAYAHRLHARLIHISTLSISGNSLADAFEVYRAAEPVKFDETCFYVGQPLDNVYIRSKFEAEREVLDAALQGLNVKIVRVGNLTNRLSDMKFQPNYQSNAFLMRMKAGLELGVLPDYLSALYTEFSPVDKTAEGVVKIAQYAKKQTVFHLNSNRNLYFDRMIEIMNALHIKMALIPGADFYAMLQKMAKNKKTSYIYEAFQNDMDASGRLVYDTNIHIQNAFTLWFLEKLGFQWPDIDMDYLQSYVAYFRGIGYLEV